MSPASCSALRSALASARSSCSREILSVSHSARCLSRAETEPAPAAEPRRRELAPASVANRDAEHAADELVADESSGERPSLAAAQERVDDWKSKYSRTRRSFIHAA